MIVTIKGQLITKNHSQIVVETSGLGYVCNISSNTYDVLPKLGNEVKLLTYFHVTETSQSLFAFSNETERELFLLLISVSGIGPKTAIILLSSITPDEFKKRLIAGEVSMLTSLPGIGPKTARRIIVELKDKFVKLSKDELPKEDGDDAPELNDAINALMALGFSSKDIRYEIRKNHKEILGLKTEQIIKKILAMLQ